SSLGGKVPVACVAVLFLSLASTPIAVAAPGRSGIPGLELWVAREESPTPFGADARAVAASPDGARVFVTGQVNHGDGLTYYGTVAYNATTGARLWAQFFDRGALLPPLDHPNALQVSPDGTKVFVTGESLGPGNCPI